MIKDLPNLFILSAAYLVVFATAELIHRLGGVKAEYTRKFVHIASAFLALCFPYMLEEIASVAILCGSFLLLLILSRRFSFLNSINGIERSSSGSYAFPAAVFICFFIYSYYNRPAELYYYLPLLLMGLCDPFAALIGRNYPWAGYQVMGDKKTVSGSFAFASLAFVITYLVLMISGYSGFLPAASIIIAVATALSEAVGIRGTDNLLIPVISMLSVSLLENLEWIIRK